MVTAVTGLALACSLAPEALARKQAHPFWDELFWGLPRPHRTLNAAKVPMPKPRPPEAPQSADQTEARGEPEIPPLIRAPTVTPSPAAAGGNKPAESEAPATPAAPQPSACREALTEDIAIAPSVAAIHGPGDCGGEDLVRLEAIVLPDKRRVLMAPAATMRCAMASGVADWVRTEIEPLAQKLGSALVEFDNLDAYECRSRNGVKGAPLSEHARANALDVRGFKLADGRSVVLTDRNQPRSFREDVLHSACARFTTVLGPDSDGYHEEHIHLDLMERHYNYKICQWDVLDPLPAVAPLLPAERPQEAPPRKVAGKEDAAKADTREEGDKQEEAPAAAAPKPDAQRSASKQRRSAKLRN